MKYIQRKVLLPDALVKSCSIISRVGISTYPQTRRSKNAGEKNPATRQELQQRNCRIRAARRQGASLEHLAEQYCLSIHAIRKIIYQK